MNLLVRSLLTLSLALLLLPAPAGAAADPPAELGPFLDELGRQVADFRTLKTDFVQTKEMALFKDKLVLKGRIYLQKPNRIAWHVDKPLRYSVLITDKLIRQWDEETNQVQELSLEQNPIFQTVLNQLTVWFSGEYGTLLGSNDVRLVQTAPLVLEFTPKANSLAVKAIRSITVTFRDDRKYLQQIRIQELSGDVTTLQFLNTRLNAPLEPGSFEVKGHV
ncbi:MAG: outer membrane lipoprotein carrier protein LolA [Deltaproteobacteria bacterium]|nr:MAG: outer membrane lipoprotein carrier protein LolA [Deltaproteobacteria bacterium]